VHDELEVELNFTDITICETDGYFEKANKIMKSEPPYSDKWILRSYVTLVSKFGIGEMELQFHGNGEVYILDYKPSIGDVYYNPDIPKLADWTREKGWKVPQPHISLIRNKKDFWRHFWDTLVLDSDYFDKIYGKRPQLEIGEK